MRRFLLALLCLLPFVAHEAHALNISGETVVIPVIGRFPGAGGSQWQTDVFIANPSTSTYPFTLKFYPSGEGVQERTFTMEPNSVRTFTDICLNTFGRTNTGGVLEIHVAIYTPQVRARIYNVGNPAGQFGQGVAGIGIGHLTRQAYLYGLSATATSRVNVGVANPNDVPTPVAFFVYDHAGAIIHTHYATVQPHQFVQFNDIVVTFGIAPQEGLAINIESGGERVYGYASEVRNDTGDAVFTFGLSPNS
ncbi:MAG TPA: hypothetical protein VGQ76_26710 [Thermoanaerobaculia bacterium]|jgi:hypothetical protein|nr:hypothetical protein [Thermoanaerobaculia bacterium]